MVRVIFQVHDIMQRTGSIKFGGFTLTSGEKSPIYFDLNRMISFPREFDIITDILARKVKETNPDKIAGASTSGIPFATAISLKTNIPMICVKRKPDIYGTRSQIIGEIIRGEKILLIDDVITDGVDKLDYIKGIQNVGGIVEHVIVLVDHEKGGKEKLQGEKVNLLSLITAKEILYQLYRVKRIDGDTFDEVIDFLRR